MMTANTSRISEHIIFFDNFTIWTPCAVMKGYVYACHDCGLQATDDNLGENYVRLYFGNHPVIPAPNNKPQCLAAAARPLCVNSAPNIQKFPEQRAWRVLLAVLHPREEIDHANTGLRGHLRTMRIFYHASTGETAARLQVAENIHDTSI